MSQGQKCPPATHRYVPHGKIALCSACADVQPLLLDEESRVYAPTTSQDAFDLPLRPPSIEPEGEPTSQELEAAVQRLREAAGLMKSGDQQELPLSDDDEELVRQSNAYGVRRVHVDDFNDMRSDTLPDPGL